MGDGRRDEGGEEEIGMDGDEWDGSRGVEGGGVV